MSFWEFANSHPIVTLLCVWAIADAVAKCIKHVSRGVTGRGKLSKMVTGAIKVKTPSAEAKSTAEKAH